MKYLIAILCLWGTLLVAAELSDREKELYLVPGGKYTASDIEANGKTAPSQKYKEFVPKHNPTPQTGRKVCPITLTQAHPDCSWIIGGKTYHFCCPICIDEFLRLAKHQPEKVKDPEFFIAK